MASEKRAREAARTMRGTAAASVEGMQRNVLGAESARVDIQSSLGAPGTYDLPQGLGLGQTAPQATANTGGLIKSEKAKSFWATQGLPEGNVETLNTMDPEAVSNRVKGSSEFRIRSRMTAESEQMLARQGDLYDRFIKNQVTPVSEALGAAARESMSERKRMMAKGGSARRQAFAMESELREKEQQASEKATQISGIMLKTDQYARDYASKTLEGNTAWLNNLGGIRDDHVKLANGVYQSMLQDALPNMFKAEMANHKMRAEAHAAKRAKTMGMVNTVLGIGMSMVGGAGAMGIMGLGKVMTPDTGMTLLEGGLSHLAKTGEGTPGGAVAGVAGGLLDSYRNQQNSQQGPVNSYGSMGGGS